MLECSLSDLYYVCPVLFSSHHFDCERWRFNYPSATKPLLHAYFHSFLIACQVLQLEEKVIICWGWLRNVRARIKNFPSNSRSFRRVSTVMDVRGLISDEINTTHVLLASSVRFSIINLKRPSCRQQETELCVWSYILEAVCNKLSLCSPSRFAEPSWALISVWSPSELLHRT